MRHSFAGALYRADLNRLRDLMLYLVKDCCGGNAGLCAPQSRAIGSLLPSRRSPDMTDRVYNVLFI
jgi:hypothetical protein